MDRMNIDWRTLSLAMMASIIVTGISGLILSIGNIVQSYPPDLFALPQNLSQYPSDKISVTIAYGGHGPSYYLPLWGLIAIFLICILVLTVLFYFIIGYLRKRKK